MGDANPIRNLGDYSKSRHEGYRNTIELSIGNNDFLKLMDSLDHDGENKERMRLCLFQFSHCDQASNWLKRLPVGSITTWEDLTTCFLAQFFPSEKTTKLRNDILMFQQHQGESLSEAWTRFKDLLQKVSHHEDLALYENKSWNDPRDFAKPVKAISLPQDVPSRSDRRLIKLENQVYRLMEAHLALMQPTQNFNNQSNLEGLVSNFMESQDARLSKFEANFKQQQSEMTNKIDTVLKAITDRMAKSLPSDMVKNSKLNTSLVSSVSSYPTIDPQCSSHPFTSINAIKTCSKEASHSQTSLLQIGMGIGTKQTEEPKSTLEDEFQDLHLNLPVLEVLVHAPIYNAMLDKYLESLELGKNGSPFVQGEVFAKMEDPWLFTLPCRLGDSKPFDTLADLGSCVNIIPLHLFKKLNIRLLKETDHIFGLADGTKSYPIGIVKNVEVHIRKLKLLNDFYVIVMKKDPETPLLVGRGFLATANAVIDCRKAKIAIGEWMTREWEISRDAEINPFKDVLVFRRMVEFLRALPINLKGNMWESEDLIKNLINWDKPPKDGDGAWHAKIRIIDPDGEEFTKTLQSIPPLENSLKEKFQGRSSTWTTSMTLDV
ncbi:MAK10-like protein [Tanacetum coccineum]|uniref:MAK10-like protein n=1 Tax=Tanacetum coccineum TaxID=301880 RepID=A0ABQ4WGX5_9ASTR